MAVRRMPGRMPPMNRSSMGICATTPYRMSGSDGGRSNPSEPDAVSRPRAKRSRYPSLISAGRSTPPSARIVTPEPPVNAVKNEHSTAHTTADPPGIQPNSARNTLRRRVEACPSARMKPARVKSGMAGSVGETLSE
jgi:hypothetical protein